MTTWKPYLRKVTYSTTEVDFNIEVEDMYKTNQTDQRVIWTTSMKVQVSEELAEILEENYQKLVG